MLRHRDWWVIFHCLSIASLWYYITLSAVIVGGWTWDANSWKQAQMRILVFDSISSVCVHEPLTAAQTIWQRQPKSQQANRLHAVTPPGNAAAHSTQDKNRDAKRAKRYCWTCMRRKWCNTTSSKCSCFYLQRRHDIPCPLKPATERCSPCSWCRCPSLSLTSTVQTKAASNPIGLIGSAS